MIGLPFNDRRCLGAVTEIVAELVANEDPVLEELARQHPTVESLIEYIRGLPQRDDAGAATDGPRVDSCDPPQRLRIPAEDPNCVERAALYVAAAEMIDPNPIRQLATLDTPIGMHTFPVENGAPIVLDPRLPRNCLDCGVAFLTGSPMAVEARDAIEWTSQLAEAGAAHLRNGPGRIRKLRNAIMELVDDGAAPADDETVDGIAWMLSLAEQVARRYGPQAISLVRTTAQAIADLADEANVRRNRSFRSARAPEPWMSELARIGLKAGVIALETKLRLLGVPDGMVNLVKDELNRQALSADSFGRPRHRTVTNRAA